MSLYGRRTTHGTEGCAKWVFVRDYVEGLVHGLSQQIPRLCWDVQARGNEERNAEAISEIVVGRRRDPDKSLLFETSVHHQLLLLRVQVIAS